MTSSFADSGKTNPSTTQCQMSHQFLDRGLVVRKCFGGIFAMNMARFGFLGYDQPQCRKVKGKNGGQREETQDS